MTELPSHWKVVKLGDKEIGSTSSGGTPNRTNPHYFDGDIPWVKSGELNDGWIYETEEKITQDGLSSSSAKLFPSGTLLIAMYGATAGKTAILGVEATTNQAICAIFPENNSFDSQFLQDYLIYVRPQILGARSGGAQPNINQRTINSLEILLPPIAEQKQIAHTLQTIQQATQTRQRELALEQERKAALMQHLFTYGTRGEALKETTIGLIPESWEVKELGQLSEIQSGGTPSRRNTDFYGGHINWVKTLDLNESIVTKTEERITESGFQSIRGRLRPVNTVMIAMYGGAGTVGKSGMLGIPATTNQAVCCIEPNPKKFESFYLLNYFIHTRSVWMRYAIGTRKDPNISKGIIQATKIPLPPLQQQQEIAKLFQACDRKLVALQLEIAGLEELFRAMLAQLMTGQLSVLPLILAVEL